jgi:uncharacterized membrane protein
VLASIAALVIYVHHIGEALRVSGLIELVGDHTRKLVDRTYPDAGPPPALDPDGPRVVDSPESGVLTMIVAEALVEEAERIDCLIELVPGLGEFVPAGAPLFVVHGWSGDVDEGRLIGALSLKPEPTLDADVAYGMRLLVDIAERSLSESPFQDPTTAVQAIDRLHDILRHLARRPFPDGRLRDRNGQVRLIVKTMAWEDYVHLAFDEIRMVGAGSPQVARRLVAALADLRGVALPARIKVLDEQSALLHAATVEAMHDPRDIRFALAGREGSGAGTP